MLRRDVKTKTDFQFSKTKYLSGVAHAGR